MMDKKTVLGNTFLCPHALCNLQASAVLNEVLNETLHSGIAVEAGREGKQWGEERRHSPYSCVCSHVRGVPGSTEVPAHLKSAREQCLRCWVLAAAVAAGTMLLRKTECFEIHLIPAVRRWLKV